MRNRTARRWWRLRRVAAALAATATAVIPGIGRAGPATVPGAVEAPSITLSARLARSEAGLAKTMARADDATLRRFARDCASRVVPLYEWHGPRGEDFRQALRREGVAAAAPCGATIALGQVGFQAIERRIARLEKDVARGVAACGPNGAGAVHAPLRMLAVSLAAAAAIDQALLIAGDHGLCCPEAVLDAVAEAVYLDSVFQGGDAAEAADAVLREVAWQHDRLRSLLREGRA